MEPILLGGIGEEIKEILYSYVKAESITYSSGEKQAESFFLSYFKNQPYWQEHPECVGTKPVKDDPFGRAASFAMVRGKGDRTIVFVHHNDVVTVEDYDRLRPLAFSPDELEVELKKRAASFSEEIRNDLESDAYLYGRGVCDMKGGGSIQMALLRRYSELVRRSPEALPGNLIVLAVPDEENLSAGMRAAVKLLAELKAQYGFTYQLMINSEPHQRKDPETGVFSMGSVGKLMPFFYIRGYLAHVGKVFEGFNPMGLLSAIVQKTEGQHGPLGRRRQ
ncbi:MAG: M20/M25/M40 family metallo-hydrolase [Oscillibacter sp.]